MCAGALVPKSSGGVLATPATSARLPAGCPVQTCELWSPRSRLIVRGQLRTAVAEVAPGGRQGASSREVVRPVLRSIPAYPSSRAVPPRATALSRSTPRCGSVGRGGRRGALSPRRLGPDGELHTGRRDPQAHPLRGRARRHRALAGRQRWLLKPGEPGLLHPALGSRGRAPARVIRPIRWLFRPPAWPRRRATGPGSPSASV